MSDQNILVYVEDPGAANYVVGLATALKKNAINCLTIAEGFAAGYLKQKGENFHSVGSESAEDILNRMKPNILIVGTSESPESFAFDLLVTAKKKNILSIGMVDAFVNAQYRFRGLSNDPLYYIPNVLLTPDKRTKKAFIDLGVNESYIHVVGNPMLDEAVNKARYFSEEDYDIVRCKLFGKKSRKKPVIVFLSELSDGLVNSEFLKSDDYTLQGRGDTNLRTEIVFQEFLDACEILTPKPLLILRLHPKENPADYQCYYKSVEQISCGGDVHQLLFFADLVVGLSTTLLIEAAVMGKPVLSIVPREIEKQWVPQSAKIVIDTVTRKKDIVPSIYQKLGKGVKYRSWLGTSNIAIEQIVSFIVQYLAVNKMEVKI